MRILLVEDGSVSQLNPIALGRPAFAITCGGYSLAELAAYYASEVVWRTRRHLRAVWTSPAPVSVAVPRASGRNGGTAVSDPLLVLNAALTPSSTMVERLVDWAAAGAEGVVSSGSRFAAAAIHSCVESLLRLEEPEAVLGEIADRQLPGQSVPVSLLEYPHDVVRHHPLLLQSNLEHRLARGEYQQIADGVFAAPGATLGQYVVLDTTRGPVVLERDASVGPYSLLRGPALLGPAARVIEHSALKDGVCLGAVTKVGGEVECSVIESYTNKQHHGFLGHSYLGSWINLGAGTCNSDLKNTYGTVNMDYQGHRVATGMQFVGCIMGDYAKTAVNTAIFTGKTIGACSMVYGFVTTNVPSFVNYARLFGQVTEAPVDVMIATQARMFERRQVKQRPCDAQLLRDMYELTRHERQLADEPLVF